MPGLDRCGEHPKRYSRVDFIRRLTYLDNPTSVIGRYAEIWVSPSMKCFGAERIFFKKYKRRTVVNGVKWKWTRRRDRWSAEFNGAGKTTSFCSVVGLIKPNAGNIYLDDEEIADLAMCRRCAKRIGYLPQEPSVFRN